MAILKVLHFPDPRLRIIAAPVTVIDQSVARIVNDLYDTMYADQGIGLAATQVGILQQIFVMDLSGNGTNPICAINPSIISQEGRQEEQEGCLSFPQVFDKVKRYAKIRLQATDLSGKLFHLDADSTLAVCIQHEIDHLQGILFIDHLSSLKRTRARQKLSKALERSSK